MSKKLRYKKPAENNKLTLLKVKSTVNGICNIKYRRNLENYSEVQKESYELAIGVDKIII